MTELPPVPISELDAPDVPTREAVAPAFDDRTRRYTIAQILGLLARADLSAKLFAEDVAFTPGILEAATVQAALEEVATVVADLMLELGEAAFLGVGVDEGDLAALGPEGRFALARLGSGAPSASNFLRGDGVFAAASGLGEGQTWQDVTASRAFSTTYTNSTGKPIMLNVGSTGVSGGQVNLNVSINGGTAFVFAYEAAGSNFAQAWGSVIVPPGATYRVTVEGGASLNKWLELRS